MCFLHAFLIAIIKKHVLLTYLKDTCPFYMWVVGNFLVQFSVWLPGKWGKVKVIKTDILIRFFSPTLSLSLSSPLKKKKKKEKEEEDRHSVLSLDVFCCFGLDR
jgi:hypothetical protein